MKINEMVNEYNNIVELKETISLEEFLKEIVKCISDNKGTSGFGLGYESIDFYAPNKIVIDAGDKIITGTFTEQNADEEV